MQWIINIMTTIKLLQMNQISAPKGVDKAVNWLDKIKAIYIIPAHLSSG